MSALPTWLRTFAALGPGNAARALAYRTGLKLGVHPVQRIAARPPAAGPFFAPPTIPPPASPPGAWRTEARLFGHYHVRLGDAAPDWLVDPLSDDAPAAPAGPLPNWWTIDDFSGGDIKRIWELSRLDWAMALAQQARAGEAGAFDRLEAWLADWARSSPAYRGPNWKCAQEASIRVLHLAVAAMLLGTESKMTGSMRAVLDAHVRRILPTLSYARAQDNNHATSEAGALFVAGAWLRLNGVAGADRMIRKGRRLIERTTLRLFARDGSFSQYSVNYHRVALDTLSLVEVWRRRANLPPFSDAWRERARVAADWLRIMTDPGTGDAPNLGANDGANLLPLTDAAYRDFRPSVQLATVLFADRRAYPAGAWDAQLSWLVTPEPAAVLTLPDRAVFDDGGYVVLRSGEATALLRYPRFRFRPSQADALHVDLWHAGENLLRDGGSYSYNTDAEWIDYFGGDASHNTIGFDDRPQMPRLSRFLLGDWLDSDEHREIPGGFVAGYRHRGGWRHRREVTLTGEGLRVVDDVSGFEQTAKLRWRLVPGDWRIDGNGVTDGRYRLDITADIDIASLELVVGWESRHYLERTVLPVLEAIVTRPGRIITEVRWTP